MGGAAALLALFTALVLRPAPVGAVDCYTGVPCGGGKRCNTNCQDAESGSFLVGTVSRTCADYAIGAPRHFFCATDGVTSKCQLSCNYPTLNTCPIPGPPCADVNPANCPGAAIAQALLSLSLPTPSGTTATDAAPALRIPWL
jgi:hypothetical protein